MSWEGPASREGILDGLRAVPKPVRWSRPSPVSAGPCLGPRSARAVRTAWVTARLQRCSRGTPVGSAVSEVASALRVTWAWQGAVLVPLLALR